MEAVFTAAKEMGFTVEGTTLTHGGFVVTMTSLDGGGVEMDCFGQFVIECASPEKAVALLPTVMRSAQKMVYIFGPQEPYV